MDFFPIKDNARILTIVRYLISEGVEVEVEIQGTDERFATRAIAIKEDTNGARLIVEKLNPEEGNSLIQSTPDAVFSFDLRGRMGLFATRYVGMYTEHPYYGLAAEFPTTVRLEDKREEKRLSSGLTELLSVEFTMEGDDKQYQLKVFDIGPRGIGAIVEKEDFDLFKKINVGDPITNIRFFLPMATMTIDAMVRHTTLIKEGQFKGCYLMGIESDYLMEIEELQEELEKMK